MLAVVDLETTGLDADACHVLEVACIVTDDQFQEVARFERVIHYPDADKLAHLKPETTEADFAAAALYTGIDVVVVKMHAATGLWSACADSPHHRLDVDDDLAEFLRGYSIITEPNGYKVRAQLVGNTINFDRGFMQEELPKAHAELHYRNIDVTSFNEMARRLWPAVYDARPRNSTIAHRAMSDAEDSLWCARYYATRLGPVDLERA